jgi:endonuclease-8
MLRLAILTDKGSAWLYSASELALLETDRLGEHPYLARLGVEALAPETRLADVHRTLRDARFAKRSLGALLLDQGFVAGVGNYLRSDILFAARLHPARKLGALEPAERVRLGRAIYTTMRRAYETGGITNEARCVARLRKAGVPRRAYRHLAFARAGEPCWTCQAEMQRSLVAGRRLYACPACQPEPSTTRGVRR